MTETQANTIKMHIDYCTEELAMTNRILEARTKYRALDEARANSKRGSDRAIANMKAINALTHLRQLEREYEDMFAPEGV